MSTLKSHTSYRQVSIVGEGLASLEEVKSKLDDIARLCPPNEPFIVRIEVRSGYDRRVMALNYDTSSQRQLLDEIIKSLGLRGVTNLVNSLKANGHKVSRAAIYMWYSGQRGISSDNIMALASLATTDELRNKILNFKSQAMAKTT
jgi:hypothetical protein